MLCPECVLFCPFLSLICSSERFSCRWFRRCNGLHLRTIPPLFALPRNRHTPENHEYTRVASFCLAHGFCPRFNRGMLRMRTMEMFHRRRGLDGTFESIFTCVRDGVSLCVFVILYLTFSLFYVCGWERDAGVHHAMLGCHLAPRERQFCGRA